MRRTPHLLLLAAAFAATAACAGTAADDDTGTAAASTAATSPSTSQSIGTSTTDAPAVVGAELAGRWAHFDIVAYEEDVLKTQIISYGFNDVSVVDGRIVDQASFCFAEQRTNQPIETSLSDAATQAITPPSTTLEVQVVDGQLRISRAPTPTPVGITLADPATDSLPSDPADAQVVDADGDGKPGITVTIRVTDELTGELYIARLEIFAWEGALVAPDRIEGLVTDTSQQLVLGASDPIFATAGSGWVQHADLAKSPLLLVRVDDTWDCDRLKAERDRLFPPVPPIDW
ncbi:MAG: hypothetical protein ACKOAZ_06615 [Ilumatobacteraceae bacterium]